jgi:stress-induced morphogen
MDLASTSGTLVNFFQTTQCNIPKDSHFHISHHENLKSELHLLIVTEAILSKSSQRHQSIVQQLCRDLKMKKNIYSV